MPHSNDWEKEFDKLVLVERPFPESEMTSEQKIAFTMHYTKVQFLKSFVKELLLSQKQELAKKLMEISVMKNDPHLGFLIRRDTMLALLQEPSSDTGSMMQLTYCSNAACKCHKQDASKPMKTEIAAFMKIMGPELPFISFESEKQEATVKLEDLRKYIDDSRALARTKAIEEAVKAVRDFKVSENADGMRTLQSRIVKALQGLKGV